MAGNSTTRVALVTSSLRLAGAEKQTMYIARALHEAQLELTCFFLGERGHYETALGQIGIHVRKIYKQNRPWSILVRLITGFYEFRPHIMFAPQFGDLLEGGIAGRLCDALVVGGIRSNGFQELKMHSRRSPWMLRLVHGIVANSKTARQNVITRGVNPQKVRVVPNVIDLSEFNEQSTASVSVPIPKDRIVAAAVGSLQPGKRVDRFVDALSLARRKAPALFGVVAGGDRGCKAALEERARQAGLDGHIIFLGEFANIPALLTRSACLVVCSEFEGFPNTILEAMAAGLPVITTPAGDAPLIVQHTKTGYVIEHGEVTKMADYMAELALSSETRARFGARGKRFCAEYSFETLQVKLLKIFCQFAAQHGRWSLARELQDLLCKTAPTIHSEVLHSSEAVI